MPGVTRYFRHAQRIYDAPLMIHPGKAEVIEAVFRSMVAGAPDGQIEAEARADREAMEAEHLAVYAASGVSFERAPGGFLLGDNGVAVIPVFNTLVQRGDSLDAASGLTGYNRIGAQVAAAMEDAQAKAILLEVDSFGGEVNGCFDLVSKIVAAGKTKPVWAIANERAFSAAYAIACGASRIVTPETGQVGSIGTLMMHVDQSKRDASQGYVYTPIVFGEKKVDFSSHFALSDRAKADAQGDVDRYGEIFVAAVAESRKISAKVVRETQAGVLNPDEAKAIGLIDGVASFSDTLNALGAQVNKSSAFSHVHGMDAAGVKAPLLEGNHMDPKDVPTPAPAANAPTADQLAAAQAKGKAEALAELDKRVAEAKIAATARVSAILQSKEAVGRAGLATHLAFDTEMTPEAADKLLAKAPKDTAKGDTPQSIFSRQMATTDNPKVGADGGDDPEDDAKATAARIVGHIKPRKQG